MPDRYMMATRATHRCGDLSREQPSLAIIYPDGEREDHYVGEWASGIGFINVEFPKDTTRPLNDEERATYSHMVIECAGRTRPIVLDEPARLRIAGRRHLRDAATICTAVLDVPGSPLRCELDAGHLDKHKNGCTRWGAARV